MDSSDERIDLFVFQNQILFASDRAKKFDHKGCPQHVFNAFFRLRIFRNKLQFVARAQALGVVRTAVPLAHARVEEVLLAEVEEEADVERGQGRDEDVDVGTLDGTALLLPESVRLDMTVCGVEGGREKRN